METFEVIAQQRTDLGKGASRRLRRLDSVPAVIYGAGQEATSLTLSHNDLLKHLQHESFYSHVLSITIGDKVEKAVLKAIQRHNSKPLILHVDFQRISETEKLDKSIPIHFINEENCVGVKQGGGIIARHLNEVEVRCFPQDLPEFIAVDMLNINVNDSIHLSDLVLPPNVELVALTHCYYPCMEGPGFGV